MSPRAYRLVVMDEICRLVRRKPLQGLHIAAFVHNNLTVAPEVERGIKFPALDLQKLYIHSFAAHPRNIALGIYLDSSADGALLEIHKHLLHTILLAHTPIL